MYIAYKSRGWVPRARVFFAAAPRGGKMEKSRRGLTADEDEGSRVSGHRRQGDEALPGAAEGRRPV